MCSSDPRHEIRNTWTPTTLYSSVYKYPKREGEVFMTVGKYIHIYILDQYTCCFSLPVLLSVNPSILFSATTCLSLKSLQINTGGSSFSCPVGGFLIVTLDFNKAEAHTFEVHLAVVREERTFQVLTRGVGRIQLFIHPRSRF